MSAISKFDLKKKPEQLHFSEENYLNYTKHTILHVTNTFSLKQGQTRARTSSGPITLPLKATKRVYCLLLFPLVLDVTCI